ncbi:MAG: phosphotransferase [Desulfobulbaceae bacterium]|nr:phosphotransferase [Desulfobulbaceae bacterium]
MESVNKLDQNEAISNLLRRHGWEDGETQTRQWLAGDGSDRRFCRIRRGGDSLLAVVPPLDNPAGMREARAVYRIGRHLGNCGVAVPACYEFDEDSGIVLCEDLGDRLLHAALPDLSDIEKKRWYEEAIQALVRLQVLGRDGFDPGWCWDTPRYDQQLMLQRESGYFRDAFCRSLLGITDFTPGLTAEFAQIAALAGAQPADYLLHRDFQSRNLMLCDGRVRIIDFQGARLGPLGYDLASLLLDPYAALAPSLRAELQAYYITTVSGYIPLDPHSFNEGYYYLFLQRNLQILGAFAFLSQQKGKVFFKDFLKPALVSLADHLAVNQGSSFPCLRALLDECFPLLEQSL